MLQQFAVLGSIFMEKTMGIEKPRVGLLNIGTEEEKGRELEHETVKLLRNTPSINFLGYVEGRDAPVGKVDVLVTDGFTGNVFLKACEGMGDRRAVREEAARRHCKAAGLQDHRRLSAAWYCEARIQGARKLGRSGIPGRFQTGEDVR